VRESLIREEVLDHTRQGFAKLSREKISSLVLQPAISDKSLRLVGSASFRILRTSIAEQFNYVCPGLQG